MLLSVLRDTSMDIGEKLLYVLIIAFCTLLSLSVHELAHGLVAYRMGDKTAKYSGRLSINPMHHLDPLGAICLFFFGFGWAKPVPVNPWNFNNKKSGMVWTSLGGPASNFILAFLAQLGVTLLGRMSFPSTAGAGYQMALLGYTICLYLAQLNLGLGIFNLIPVPPLDGSKVLSAVLPQRLYFKMMEYERYGFIALIVLINLPFFNILLYECRSAVLGFYDMIIGLMIH